MGRRSDHDRHWHSPESGLTAAELMIVVAIFVLMSGAM